MTTIYPPDEHILRDLQIESWLEAPDHCIAEMAVTDPMRSADGGLSLGALVTAVDIACARVSSQVALPNGIATADLSIVTSARIHTAARVEARLRRAGSRLISLGVTVEGDRGEAAGAGAACFVRIPGNAFVVARQPQEVGVRTSMPPTGPPLAVPLAERMQLRVGDGEAVLHNHEYVRNSFGSINGGVLGIVVVAAAEDATGLLAADVTLRYVGQTKVGPARATATVVRRSLDHAVTEVNVVDSGADDLLLAHAIVTTARG
jgi:acyl-coenzyme A thioesterase PaaI-like protein